MRACGFGGAKSWEDALVRVGASSSKPVAFANLVRVHVCECPDVQLALTGNGEAGVGISPWPLNSLLPHTLRSTWGWWRGGISEKDSAALRGSVSVATGGHYGE